MTAWAAALATLGLVASYEAWLVLARRAPARSAHAGLRDDWFNAVSQQPGSEILAVQTLRNSLMSASMIASTAVLALMGAITLSAPSLKGLGEGAAALPHFTPRLLMELLLLALLFASLVTAVMAVRYYNHAGFIGGMPVGSPARTQWTPIGVRYVRRAGLLYSWSLRHLMLVLPVVAYVLHPLAGPLTAVLLVVVLYRFDRAHAQA